MKEIRLSSIYSSNNKPVEVVYTGKMYIVNGLKEPVFVYSPAELRKKLKKTVIVGDKKLDMWADEAFALLEPTASEHELLMNHFTELFTRVNNKNNNPGLPCISESDLGKFTEILDKYEIGKRSASDVTGIIIGALSKAFPDLSDSNKEVLQKSFTAFFLQLGDESKQVATDALKSIING